MAAKTTRCCLPLRSTQSRPRAGQKWTTRPVMAVDGLAPEGLGGREVLIDEWAEVRVLNELVFAAVFVGAVGRVLPDPLDVARYGLLFFSGRLGRAGWRHRGDLRGRERGREEEKGGELEEAAH